MGWSGLKHMANNIDVSKQDEQQLGDKWTSALERVISGASAGMSRAISDRFSSVTDGLRSERNSTSSLAEDSSCHGSNHGSGRSFFGVQNPGVTAAARV